MTTLLPKPDQSEQAVQVRGEIRTDLDQASAELSELNRARLVVLTHYLPPYMTRVLQHVSRSIPEMHVLLSIPLEPNRNYALDWDHLNVQVQKSVMMRRPWRHHAGFQDELYVHVPYDTYGRLRRLRPDLIFSYELGFRSLASAMYRRLNRRTRLAYCVCVSEHTETGRGSSRWLLRKLLVRMADAVTYNGPSCRSYLERLAVPDSKLFHFPYAADDRTVPPPRPLESVANKHLLVLGQINERKGVMPALGGLASYCVAHPDQSWQVTFIGAGAQAEAVKSFAAPSNLQVHVEGQLAPEQLTNVWNRFGVLLFPTLADEWGLVVNEAMRAGLPVIGSRFAQASTTLIQHGVNGWIYSPDQPNELHLCLQLLNDLSFDRLQAMREEARQTVANITSHAASQAACQMFAQLLKS